MDDPGHKSEIDPYGFRRPEDFDYETYDQFMSQYLSVLVRRAGKWDSILNRQQKIKKSRKVKRYVRKGIPNSSRGEVWMYVSKAYRLKDANPGLYSRLLHQEFNQELVETIDTDIHRTFPENIYFCNDATDSKRNSLRNILLAFAHHNPDIGYCQGLNFIVAMMVLIVKNEEDCFFLLEILAKKILIGYYTSDLNGLKVDQEVLGELVYTRYPAVAEHMTKEDCPWSIPTTKWFICLFLDILPVETTLRIWDCLFYEGSKVLFRVCLSIIKQNSTSLLQASNFPLIVEAFKKATQQAKYIECHTFMENVFIDSQPLKRAEITRLREKHNRLLNPDTAHQ